MFIFLYNKNIRFKIHPEPFTLAGGNIAETQHFTLVLNEASRLIDFSAKNDDQRFPSPLDPWKKLIYPAGSYILVRIPNPGDPKVFVHDLLVIKKEYDKGRILGLSVPAWEFLNSQAISGVTIRPLKLVVLAPQASLEPREDKAAQTASAS